MIKPSFYVLLFIYSCIVYSGELYAETKIWFHPLFARDGSGELAKFTLMDTHKKNGKKLFYGMRYELPWSRFANAPGEFNWDELDALMRNAREFDYKVYVVLHDKTWFNGNDKTNNWPVPLNEAVATPQKYYEVKRVSDTVRVAMRWYTDDKEVKLIEEWYLNAIEAIAERSKDNEYKDDYKQLEVISLGESSLAYGDTSDDKAILKELGYPGAIGYKTHLKRLLGRASNRTKKHNSNIKIALNLNWIPGQSKNSQKWLQHEVFLAVEENDNAVQAIEDVHAFGATMGKDYWDRIYKYTLDTPGNSRTVPRNRVWAHISCDTKKNGKTADQNYAIARLLADNIVLRDGAVNRNGEKVCDGSTTFQEYVTEAKK